MFSSKNFCNVHRFRFSGMKCPFCEQERINKMALKFVKEKPEYENREITKDDLEKLKQKFNNRI